MNKQTCLSRLLLASDQTVSKEQAIISTIFAALAVAITVIVVYGAYFGGITAFLLRSSFYSLVATAAMFYIASSSGIRTRYFLYTLSIIAFIPGPYLWYSYMDIIIRGAMSVPVDRFVFLGLLLVTIIYVAKSVGWALIVLMSAALSYAVFGDFIPGKYGHSGYDLSRLTSTLLLSTEGFYGIPMGVAVEYIFLFALFGSLLTKIGTGEVFVDIARGITGRVKGGPGLSAALSSALLGSLNGSAVANVVTTGTFTIPLMKRVGYSAKLAGAIEAAASSAGQIMPPVMGAAAFLMAEIIGMPYADIALAALVPALLFILALMISVRLEAGKLDLDCDHAAGFDLLLESLKKRGYLLFPLAVLIGAMVIGYTPTQAAVFGLIAGLIVSPWKADTRIDLIDLINVCRETLVNTLPIVAAVASAGLIIGILNLTGLGLMLSGLIVSLGDGNLWVILILTALASFVLGMGLPTSAAYLLLAVLVAPAMTQAGMEALSAHMFIFYFGLVSAITPPVALAAYAAANISGAKPNETAIEAMRLGFVKILIPFLFVTMPGILLIGTVESIVVAILLATLATVSMSIGFTGWLGRRLTKFEKVGFLLAGVMIAWPEPAASLETTVLLLRACGLLVLVGLIVGLNVSKGAAYSRS